MTVSDVVTSFRGLVPNLVAAPATSSHALPPKTGRRVREALVEQVPMERMLGQLREIIIGPHQRLCEARFEEMLDILAEQKDGADERFEAIESELDEVRQSTVRMENLFSAFDIRFEDLSDKVDDKTLAVQEALQEAISELKGDFAMKMEMISDTLSTCIKELELETRRGLLDLSSSFVAHVADEDKKWEKERDHSLNTLEQRIAQWRAEIDDGRKQDMDDVAASLIDIGKRMMALRNGGT
jgi:hypothetical protein